MRRSVFARPSFAARWPYRLNRQTPLARGLVGWWPMFNQPHTPFLQFAAAFEGVGFVNFALGGDRNGDPGAGNTHDLLTFQDPGERSVVPDLFGVETFKENGADSFLRMRGQDTIFQPPAGQDGDVTVAMWIYVVSTDGTRFGLTGYGDFNNEGWGLYVNEADDLLRGYAGTWDVNGVSSETIQKNHWHRVGIRVHRTSADSMTCEPFLDGRVGTTSTAQTPATLGNRRLEFGAIGSFREWTGWFGHCCAWNRSLSDTEILRDYLGPTRWELFEELPVPRALFVPPAGEADVFFGASGAAFRGRPRMVPSGVS